MTIDSPRPYPPTIDFTALRLRPLVIADAPALYTYLQDPVRYGIDQLSCSNNGAGGNHHRAFANRWTAGELGKWALLCRTTIKSSALADSNDTSLSHRWAELAFDLAPRYWGNGLMRQAITGNAPVDFPTGSYRPVHAYVRVDNQRSKQLLERLGFTLEGCLRSYRVCRGKSHDFNIFSLLRSEWTGGEV